MKLQYFVHIDTDTEELKYLLAHKRQIRPNVFKSKLSDGKPALLKTEDQYIYVYF